MMQPLEARANADCEIALGVTEWTGNSRFGTKGPEARTVRPQLHLSR